MVSFVVNVDSQYILRVLTPKRFLENWDMGYFFQIAVLLKLHALYQQITKSRFKEGNDLVTVLLTYVCNHLHVR